MPIRRLLVAGLGLLIVVAGGWASFGAPRITLVNAGLRIEYPWRQGAGALSAALGLALVAAALRVRWARIGTAAVALAAALIGMNRVTYRLEADDRGLVSRSWLGPTVVPWADVTRVQSGPEVVVVWGNGDAQVRVDTSHFEPQQRATLDRTISRRVKESARRTP
jgi:Bacterial PH domain